jgi:two-component system, NarL family, response regulator NreC
LNVSDTPTKASVAFTAFLEPGNATPWLGYSRYTKRRLGTETQPMLVSNGNGNARVTVQHQYVLLLDDHAVVRQGTCQLIEPLEGFTVAAELANLEELGLWLKQPKPPITLCVLDLGLPEGSVLTFVPQLKALLGSPKLVIFSAHTELPYVQKALSLGVDAFLAKTLEPRLFQEALKQLPYLAPQALPLVLPTSLNVSLTQSPGEPELLNWETVLSPREQETLLHVAHGLTNKQIADHLVVSVKTVDSHVARVMKKLKMKNRSQLTAFACQYGLV